ncbi:SIR2 family protein [Clostridium felsineum]|uniref:SIR2 family protein n=1 Tax=Clostridium felsineum TaxID=36839 RepID=UPI00098CCA57|nr:SIR2 family protein [Clostridium felsineum]URZ15468.1 hypothetical protein CLFE_015080 [Clostridium felsineum DSM 794]
METVKFENVKEEIKSLIKNRKLIPIIGAGFTFGEKAFNGVVPNGNMMEQHMRDELIKEKPNLKNKLIEKGFQDIGKYYIRYINKNKRDNFLKDNFTNVVLNSYKQLFVKINWPCIYTLNFDDALERYNNYEVIYPYKNYKENIREEFKCIFKLHGDAKYEIKYKDSNLIFSRNDYIKSLTDNSEIRRFFEMDYIGNNIMYVGCSLKNELDLLFSVYKTTQISKFKVNRYYITDQKLDELELADLEDYNITKVVLIDNYNDFYNEMNKINNSTNEIEIDELEMFRNIQLEKINMSTEENLKNLLFSISGINENEKFKYRLPNFYMYRTVSDKIIENLETKRVHLIVGHRMSGKTYLVFNLIDKIKDRDTYFIPSKYNVNFINLDKLINKKRIVIFFDSSTLGIDELDYIITNKHRINENDIYIFILLNTSDKLLLSSFRDDDYIDLDIELYNQLKGNEVNKINEKLSLKTLPKFGYKLSILDNLYSYQDFCKNNYPEIFAKCDLKSVDIPLNESELITFIMLATNDKLLLSEIKILGLEVEISKIIDNYNTIIQVDYTLRIEKGYSVGYKIVPNAKYWILTALGNFAKIKTNRVDIAKAICKIVKLLRKEQEHFETSIQIMLFDTLNDIFPSEKGGAVGLIHKIYEELGEILHGDNHYLIQRAKSILYLDSDRIKELRKGVLFADTSHRNLIKEKESCNIEKKTRKIENVIQHAVLTKAMLYGRIININKYSNIDDIKRTIENYYEAFNANDNQAYVRGLMKKTLKNKHSTKSDLYMLITNYKNAGELGKEYRRKISFIANTLKSYEKNNFRK